MKKCDDEENGKVRKEGEGKTIETKW